MSLSPVVARGAITGPLESSNERTIFGVTTAFLILAVISVAIRFFGRRVRKQKYGLDDWLCLASMCTFVIEIGLVYQSEPHTNLYSEVGHQPNLLLLDVLQGHAGNPNMTPADVEDFSRIAFAVQFPYGFTMGFVRLSIISLEYRIFTPYRSFRYICYAMMALVVAWVIFVVVAALAVCQPLPYYWDKSIQGGYCGDQTNIYRAIAAIGIGTDLIIFIAPIPMIWRLNMRMRQKIGVLIIFALGLL